MRGQPNEVQYRDEPLRRNGSWADCRFFSQRRRVNLIPDQGQDSRNYWCTWNAQHPMWDIELEEDLRAFRFLQGHRRRKRCPEPDEPGGTARKSGLGDSFWPRIAGICICVSTMVGTSRHRIDAGTERWRFGSLVLNSERFPDFTGAPAERVRRLNEQLRSVGWRGLALWVAAQCEGDGRDGKLAGASECESYWRERARWSARPVSSTGKWIGAFAGGERARFAAR